jgi:alpha-acetolactate decarboxylase
MTRKLFAIGTFAATVLAAATGCAWHSKNWNGRVYVWGTMHEVLGEGKTQGRVALADALHWPGATGVGALESLEGEVTIFDGHAWVAMGSPDALTEKDRMAAFLTVAYVPSWRSIPIEAPIRFADFDQIIAEQARQAGLDTARPIPFRIRGRLSVSAHVVQGKCPHAQDETDSASPHRIAFQENDAEGIIVGFYADNSEGVLTHHGTKTHAHVLFFDGHPRTGHVDSVTVAPGSIIQFPKTR